MLKRLKCWWYGHQWRQQGYVKIRHFWEDPEIEKKPYKTTDNFLFICTRCSKIWEYEAKHSYVTCDNFEESLEEIL